MKVALLFFLSLFSFTTFACSDEKRQSYDLFLKVEGNYIPTNGGTFSVCSTGTEINNQLSNFFTLFNRSDAEGIAEKFTENSEKKEIADFIKPFEIAFEKNKTYTFESAYQQGLYIYAIFSVEGKYRNYMRFIKADEDKVFLKEHLIKRDSIGVLLAESSIRKVAHHKGKDEYLLGEKKPVKLRFDLTDCLKNCSNQYVKYIEEKKKLIQEGKLDSYIDDLTAKSSIKVEEWIAQIPPEERSIAILHYLIPQNITYVVDFGEVVIVGWLSDNDFNKVIDIYENKISSVNLPVVAVKHLFLLKDNNDDLTIANVYYESIVDDMFKKDLVFLKKLFQ